MRKPESGVVVATRGKQFEVRTETGDRLVCEVRKKVKFETESTTPVAVGDDVLVSRADGDTGAIEKVLDRRTSFERPEVGVSQKTERKQVLAANIDLLAIVASIREPALKTGLLDRMMIAALAGGMQPLIVLNKIDLADADQYGSIIEIYRSVSAGAFAVSALVGTGLDDLLHSLHDHRTMFAGHSGVGKSTLLNALIPGLDLKTREISTYSGRGKHVTTHIELFELPGGGFVIDSPGLKVMGLWDVEPDDLNHFYPEFEPFAPDCRFPSCTHVHEPDCAVKAAVAAGKIVGFRHENYVAIFESQTAERRDKFKQ